MRLTARIAGPDGEYVEQEFEVADYSDVARAIRAAAGPYSMLSIDGEDA